MLAITRRAWCGILISAGALAGTAAAATPESGTVSKAAPKVTWAGQTTASYFTRLPVAVMEDDTVPCQAPSCDTFALTVGDSANLTVGADIVQPDSNAGSVTLRIRKPDDSVIVASSEADSVSEGKPFKVVIKSAPTGAYTVEYWNNFYDGPIDYNAFAELAVAAPPPPPVDGGGGTPPAQEAIALEVKVGSASARRLARTRKLTATVTVSREVSSISAVLKKGARTVGKGKLGTTSGTKRLTVRTSRKKLAAGTYALTVAATDGKTSTTKTVKVKVRR